MLINLRNALMGGKRLPYDAELEYLESSGTQYIDTGVVPAPMLDYSISFAFTSMSSYSYIMGAWSSNNSNYYDLAEQSNTLLYAGLGTTQQAIANIPVGVFSTVEKRGLEIYVDGVKKKTFSADIQSGSISSTILLFGVHRNYGPGYIVAAQPLRIEAFSLKSNGTLVRDFIPVRKGTVGYLYDRVSGKLFGNAGTGDFVLGPDVVPVEWLQTDGNAYISGKLPRTIANASWGSIKFSLPFGNLGSDQRMFTLVDSSRNRMLYVGNGWNGEYYAVAGGIACVPNYYFNRWRVSDLSRETTHTVQFSGDTLLLDGTAPYDEQTSGWVAYNVSNATSFELFRNSNGAASTSPHRFEGFDIADVNGKALAIRPVRVGSGTSWEGAMMDTLTRRIYRNAGTGAFTYGNDLKYPIPAE